MTAVPLFFLSRWQTYQWANYGPRYSPTLFSAFTITQIAQTSALASIVAGPGGQWRVAYGRAPGKYDQLSARVQATAGVGSSVVLTGLQPNTPYFCNVALSGYLPNPAGLPLSGAYYTDEQTFTTLGPPAQQVPPQILTQAADPSVASGECVFAWTTDVPVSGEIEWGADTTYGHLQAQSAAGAATITGLTPGNTYHYRIRVTGTSPPNNVETIGADHTFVAQ